MVRLIAILLLMASPAVAQDDLPAEKARLQVILDPLDARPFADQMLLATVRGDYRVTIALQDLTLPHSGSFDWVQLARDQWTLEQVDGLPTQVMRRRIAIFPQRAGELSFPALDHKLTIVTPSGGRAEHDVFSEPVRISVRPAPGQPWLPVAAIEYSDEWSTDPGALPLGETVQRRVVVRALGATADMIPPRPEIRAAWLISFASPEERSTELTPLGPLTTVVWQWSLRPKTGERGVIPEIQIPYFDTNSASPGTLVLKATPVGYADAPDMMAPELWRSGFTGVRYPVFGFLLGLLVPFLVLGTDMRLRSRGEVRHWLSRLRPDGDCRRLTRAARRGDVAAMRQAAVRLAAKLSLDRADAIRELLDPIDRHLFGPTAPAPLSLRMRARTILRIARSRPGNAGLTEFTSRGRHLL